jgi:hypothetical protein
VEVKVTQLSNYGKTKTVSAPTSSLVSSKNMPSKWLRNGVVAKHYKVGCRWGEDKGVV